MKINTGSEELLMKYDLNKMLEKNMLEFRCMSGLNNAEKLLKKVVATAVSENGLTISQFDVLQALYRSGKCLHIYELLERLITTPGNMTVILRNMEKAGLISRQTDEEDRRAYLIDITDEGIKVFENILPSHIENIKKFLGSLDTEEKEQLVYLLGKITCKTGSGKTENGNALTEVREI